MPAPAIATSPLGPIDPESLKAAEEEKHAPWIVRKLVGSMTGRIVMSSFETLRSTGTTVICLSPWGDSSPLLLPCIRFRDLAVHTVIAATGGVAAIASPALDPMSDVILGVVGDSLLVEVGMHEGFELSVKAADDFIFDGTVKMLVPLHSRVLESNSVKIITITLKFKHTPDDAALGFFRSSLHEDSSLFSSVKDYLAIEKGWMSPYLFASGRRPVIPRSMTPDFVFAHGPFLSGDYKIAETLLGHSAVAMHFCAHPVPPTPSERPSFTAKLSAPLLRPERSRTPSPEPTLAPVPTPPQPRRLVVLVLGIKPHRAGLWTSSQRPSESVIQYVLLSGAPALVLPAALGSPLLAWFTRTLADLWKLEVPQEDAAGAAAAGNAMARARASDARANTFTGMLASLAEYVGLCVDWARVEVPGAPGVDEPAKRRAIEEALALVLAAAMRSAESKKVKKEIDPDRAGIAIWRTT